MPSTYIFNKLNIHIGKDHGFKIWRFEIVWKGKQIFLKKIKF